MEFGICMASHVGDVDYVVRAEELGFSHAWLADSQMLWSDVYATLALAAVRTSRIRLGTGVAVSGTRPAPVNAAGIATINALAPGRTFFGVGAGNTAMRVMGQPPHRLREFERYLREVIPLVRGEEALHGEPGREQPIRHILPDRGFVNFADRIPVYVSGFGPRSLGLAGRYGDGAVCGLPSNRAVMEVVWSYLETGASQADRTIDRSAFPLTALTAIGILAPGEAVDSDRIKHLCGAMAMASVHYSYDQWRNFGHPPPAPLAGIWDDYRALLDAFDETRRHQRIHAGHNCWVLPEEERFLTSDVLAGTCLIGTRDALIDRLGDLSAGGLDQVMILPGFDGRFDAIEDVARELIGKV